MAEAPAGGAGGAAGAKQDPQALIAKHAAVTQAGAQGDQAIVARVENAIKNSPMGWLQGVLGETGSRAASEQSQVSGKLAEHKDLVANQKDVPKDAGPPPAPGPAAHPAVPHPAAPAQAAVAAPAPAGGGAAAEHAPIAASAPPKSAPAAAPAAAPAPTVASAVAGAGDSQIDGILNTYTPKGQQSTQTIGRIKSMGDIAQGFNGQLDTYIAQGGAVESGIAGAANFLGVGKDVSAVWANNPYRKVHGILGGIMTGMSAVKNVCGVVGSICGKLGMVLTVIGLLGMIFPPIGAAVSGIARILNVVGLICDSISFVLSGILTGLNGVVLAQQIAAGASAEEKAATADLMMSEANDAASGFVNLAIVFGPRFMKGLLGNSKGVVASLIKQAKATIGRVSLKLSANVSHFANKIVRKLGFGGASMSRVGGAWKDTGFLASTKEKWVGSKVGKAFYGAPQHLQAVQDKLMAKYGSTAWAKNMDRVGAWGGSVAHRLEKFDLGEQAGRLGEKTGSKIGSGFAETTVGKSMAAAAERSELQTRELAMKMEARDASHLEETRWKNELNRRQAANPDHVREPGAENKFVAGQGQKVRDDKMDEFQSQERQREAKERLEQRRTDRFERRNDEFYENKTNGITGVGARDEMMAGVHNTRERRYALEAELKPQETERKELLAKTTKTAADTERLTALNGELRKLDEARRVNKMYETDLSGLASGAERVRAPEYNNWKDVGSNAWEATAPALEMAHLKDQDAAWALAEKADLKKQTKYNKGTAQANAAGRGGHGTFADIAADARHRELDDLTEFVRAAPQTRTVTGSVRGMLSPIITRGEPAAPAAAAAPQHAAPAAPTTAPTMAPTTAPAAVGPGDAHAPGGVNVQPTEHKEGSPAGASMQVAAQVHEPPVTAAAPAHDEQKDAPAPDEAGGEALPYWPALIPEFDKATTDFGWMRKVAVEFKKAQIEGKQKAVDTLAVYGRYKEYAAARAAAAQKNTAAAAQTGQATQQNVGHASQTEGQAGQGEQKQGEAKGAANDRAATELPEPESRGFWGRILGAVKRWAKNKAAQVFGWIQEKIASVILKGLCGVSMGDMREYAGALRRQQQAAHGVADGAGKTSGQAQQTSIKLSSDATKEAQGAADAIGECDKNIVDADQFMADIGSFEQQLAEEKAHAQMFIASVHAAAEAERTKQQTEAAAHAAEEKKEQERAAQLGGGSGAPAAAPASAPVQAAAAAPVAGEPAHEPAAPEGSEQDVSQIHAASQYVATESEAMTGKLEARADDYTNQLALALTNRTGKGADGVDLKGPAKKESKHIVEEFKAAAQHTKIDMEAFHNMSIDPSQSKRIAEQIISSAQHLEETYNHSENALDELFARTYNGIKDGRRTLKSRMLDGDNAIGAVNHTGDAVGNKAIDTALPTMNTAWDTVAKPIQAPAAAPAPVPAAAPAPAAAPTMTAAADPRDVAIASSATRPMPAPDRVPDAVSSTLARAQGAPLPAPEHWSRRVGADVSHAKIVTGEGAPEAAESIGARAFTVGERVFFARGNDEKTDGGNLLAHELTHVAQQKGGTAPGSWEQTPFVDYHDQREVAARAHDGAPQTGSSEHAIARDAEPDINNEQYLAKFSGQIGDGIVQYLTTHDLPSGSRFVTFPGPLLPGPAIVGVTGAALTAKLDAWIGKDKLWRAVDHNRPKGTEQVTDGNKTWVEEKGHDGPGRWFPDIATELGAALHAAIRVSLDRVVARYQSAAVATGIAAEDKSKQSLTTPPPPRRGDIIASSPLDVQTIDALIQYAHFDYPAYRGAYPQEKGKLGTLRAVDLKVEAPKDGVLYARVKTPVDATKEEVANQIFGSSTLSGELQIVAPPLFGFADGSKLKSQYAEPLAAAGVKLNVSVVDPIAAAAKGPMAEEIAKNQGLQQSSKIATKTGVLAVIDENVAIIATIEKSGAAFGMGKNPTVSSLAPLVKELNDRRTKIAAMSEEDALSWAGQVEGQQGVLSQVSFSFARHAQRLADLTKMVTDPKIKLGGFNLPPHVREAMDVVAMRYADVCLISAMPGAATVKLAEIEELAGALPVTFLEGTLASIQGALDAARETKHGEAEHQSYDVGGMQNREIELKRRLVALRERIKTDPEGATKELGDISKLVSELQTETELVANMDRIDSAWQALDKGISFWWTSLITQHKASNLKEDGDRLHKRWKDIFTAWKSGDPKQQELAKQNLDKLRNDGELTAWLGKVQGILKDAQIERMISEFVVVIAITVVTAGVGDLVVAGAAGWELSAGTTAVLAGGAEAATFTLLNQVFLDSDHSLGHVAYEFGTNWAMFGVMRRFQMFAEVAKLSKVTTMTGQTLLMAASTYAKADLDKYIKEGRHLNQDEVKQIALQGLAMAIAMHAIAPAMKPMWEELEGSTYKFASTLKANNRMRDTLQVKAEALKGTRDYASAIEYVTNERVWLEERIKILDDIEATAKAEEQGGKKPAGGGIASKIKMNAAELDAMRTDLKGKLAAVTGGELPLMTLEPKGDGLFTCPREHIYEVVKALGEEVGKKTDPVTTVTTYEVKLKDGGGNIKVMEKIDPATDWVAHLKSELTPDGRVKFDQATKGMTPQQIHDHYHGSTDEALLGLDTPRAKGSAKNTLELFGNGAVPEDPNAQWQYKNDPSHWSPQRQALHNRLLAEAKADALKFADAAPKGEPTLYAMRGNTAAGKTRAVANNVPELANTMKVTSNMGKRAVNPDAFKQQLMTADGQNLTSSQVHAESSMLADRFQQEMLDTKGADGKPVSMLIDKRLATLADVQGYADLAKATGRKFVLYDVEAPLEASLAGVLERQPGGADPLPPYEVVANGFKAIHENRAGVVAVFQSDPALGTYELFGTKPTGERVPVATVKNGALTVTDAALYADAIAGPDTIPELVGKKRITEASIQEFTKDVPGDRRTMMQNLLRKYVGWTWRDALDAHAKEKSPVTPVQRKATGDAGVADPSGVAAAGVESANDRLPHHDQIQASFGRHDVSGIRAQTGGAAAEASRGIGAKAYAVGNRVGFAESPDLHTAAHEAAHVVQQQAGVHLPAGIDGGKDDRYEQHADAVADHVVRGESAEGLLETMGPSKSGASAQSAPVQRKGEVKPQHGMVNARRYLNYNANDARNAITSHLMAVRMPQPHARLQWRVEQAFYERLFLNFNTFAVSFEHPFEFAQALFPGDPYGLIDQMRPVTRDVEAQNKQDAMAGGPVGPWTWSPAIGLALAQLVEQSVINSLYRLGPRFIDVAERDGAASGSVSVDPELVPRSHPMDRLVLPAMCRPHVFDLAKDPSAKSKKPKSDPKVGLRPVQVPWVESKELWNWVRATPADATAEEVSAALFGYAAEQDGEKSADYYAVFLTAAPPLFGVPPQWAKRFDGPNGNSKYRPDKLPAADSDPDHQLRQLGETKAGDEQALLEAGAPIPAKGAKQPVEPGSGHDDLVADVTSQATFLKQKLAGWNLGDEADAALTFASRRRGDGADAAKWVPVLKAQRDNLSTTSTGILNLDKAIDQMNLKRTGPQAAPLREIMRFYADAVSVSHLDKSAKHLILRAANAQTSLAAQGLQNTIHELDSSTETMREGMPQNDWDRNKISRDTGSLDSEAVAMQTKLMRGDKVDGEKLEDLQLRAEETALDAKLTSVNFALAQLESAAAEAGDGVASWFAARFSSDFRHLGDATNAIRTEVQEIRDRWEHAKQYADMPQDNVNSDDDLKAQIVRIRKQGVKSSNYDLNELSKREKISNFLREGANLVKWQQFRTACVKVAAMIGVSLIGGAVGGLVARGVAGMMMGTEGAVAIESLSLGGSIVARGAGMVSETAVTTLGQGVVFGEGNLGSAFLENMIMSLGSEGVLKMIGSKAEEAAKLEKATAGFWTKAAAGGKFVLAESAAISGHAIMGIAMGYVAHKIVTGKEQPPPATLEEWMLQGASIAVGRYVGHAIVASQKGRARLKGANVEGADRLVMDSDRLSQLAKQAEADPKASDAMDLLVKRHQLLTEEMKVLEDLEKNPAKMKAAKLDAKDIRETKAEIHRQLADAHSEGLGEVALQTSGMHELIPGALWSGSESDVKALVAKSRESGIDASATPDPHGGKWHVKVGDKEIVVEERPESARTKQLGMENRGAPYEDQTKPETSADMPHEHIPDKKLRPFRNLDVVTSWEGGNGAAARLKKGESFAIGKKIKTPKEGHQFIQRLAAGDVSALAEIGIAGAPHDLNTSTREWALVQTRDGFAIYVGKHDAVNLPVDVRVLAHNHPAPVKGGPEEGRVIDLPADAHGVDLKTMLKTSPDEAKKSGITPSAKDIQSISDGGDHVIYTRYINLGGGKVANPVTTGPKVEIHLSDTHVVLQKSRSASFYYETTMVVKDSTGAEIWTGKIYTEWYAPTSSGVVHFDEPPVFSRPEQAGWERVKK